MSPARVVEATQKENDFQTVTSALDALLVTVHQLSLREQELQRRVKLAHDEVSFSCFSSFVSFRTTHSCDEKIFKSISSRS